MVLLVKNPPYSCLENPMDRGAWWATVHRVAQSRTRLRRLSTQVGLQGSPLPGSSSRPSPTSPHKTIGFSKLTKLFPALHWQGPHPHPHPPLGQILCIESPFSVKRVEASSQTLHFPRSPAAQALDVIFFFYSCIYLFGAVLGLCCRVRASRCSGFSCCGAQALRGVGFSGRGTWA